VSGVGEGVKFDVFGESEKQVIKCLLYDVQNDSPARASALGFPVGGVFGCANCKMQFTYRREDGQDMYDLRRADLTFLQRPRSHADHLRWGFEWKYASKNEQKKIIRTQGYKFSAFLHLSQIGPGNPITSLSDLAIPDKMHSSDMNLTKIQIEVSVSNVSLSTCPHSVNLLRALHARHPRHRIHKLYRHKHTTHVIHSHISLHAHQSLLILHSSHDTPTLTPSHSPTIAFTHLTDPTHSFHSLPLSLFTVTQFTPLHIHIHSPFTFLTQRTPLTPRTP